MNPLLNRLDKWRHDAFLHLLTWCIPQREPCTFVDFRDVQRILIVRNDGLGDAIITIPAIQLIRRLAPAVRIDVLASSRNAAVFASMPEVTTVFIATGTLLDWCEKLFVLRKQSYDVILLTVGTQTSLRALFLNMIAHPSSIIAAVSRGPAYRGYFNFYSERATERCHEVERIFTLVADLCGHIFLESDLELYFPRVELSWHKALEHLHAIGIEPYCYILLNLSAYQRHNQWGKHQIDQILSLIRQHDSLPILACGIHADIQSYRPILQKHSIRIYPATNDLHQIAAIVAHSRCVVTPDTGIVHLAAAFKIPLVALYSANDHNEYLWSPYRHPEVSVLLSKRGFPLSTISADAVVDAIHHRLAANTATQPV